jgi:hypothetical protein
MDKSDIAGILGLLLGGAGGYYGGKKRGEREDKKLADYFDMMKELEGVSDGTTNTVSEGSGISTTGGSVPDYISESDELLDMMTGKFSGSPTATDYLESYMDPNSPDYDPQSIFNPADYFDGKGPIPFNPFKMNEGGRVGLDNGGLLFNALGGDKTGKGSKITLLDALSNFQGSDSILSMLASLANMGIGLNEGGRVGLANGGLGYSYKNNIFSADPSLTRPVVVDEDDDGVANQTFMNLFPGLFPPVETPAENILDTPAVPMGGGGGENNPFSNNYTGDPNIPFGENPMYGPSSGYDPDDPENSFLDKLGYSFYSNVALPTATMMKKNPFSIANILGSVFGDKDNDKGDPDPKGKPGPGVSGAGTDGTGGPDSQYGGDGKGEGKGKGFGGDKGVGQDAGTVGGTGGRRGGAGRYM